MAKLIASRSTQYPMVAEFEFNFNDTMVNVDGAEVDFGATNTTATTVEVIPLPPGAVVISGSVDTYTAFDAATLNVTVGDMNDADRYLGTTDIKSVGTRALVPTGYRGNGENIRLTFNAADICNTGKAVVRVGYVVENRTNEVQIS